MFSEGKIPVSVIVATRNEARRLGRCLAALAGFDEIIVVDSASIDATKDIARIAGAQVVDFVWNGAYPKKRQWCLDHLPTRHDWILFVDADEIMTAEQADEIRRLFPDPSCDGYFIPGRYVIGGRVLRHGLQNAKLALFQRTKFRYPEINDIGLPGLGDVEGHYQPVFCASDIKIGRLHNALLHEAEDGWESRHQKYALWEAGMNIRNAWPVDPVSYRQFLKVAFRRLPFRGAIAFLHCYVLKAGFLDGAAGFKFAMTRARYYRMVASATSKARAIGGEKS